MRRLLSRAILFAVPLLSAYSPLDAQTPGRAAPLLELAPGARAAGLGGAAQLGVQDPDHLFTHPAFLGSGGFRFTAWAIDGGATIASMATGTAAFGGTIGFGVRAAEWNGSVPVDGAGGLDELVSGGATGRSAVAATVGYRRDFPFDLLGLELGATATLVSDRVDDTRDRGVSFDVGVGRGIGPLDISLAARNLGGELEIPAETALPARYELALGGYGHQLGPLDVGAAGRVGVRDDDEVVFGGGVEFGYYPVQGRTFVVRVGGQSVPEGDASPVTLGGTFRGDNVVVDWAWRDVDGSAVHVFTIGWR
jgi:hypothetical protein